MGEGSLPQRHAPRFGEPKEGRTLKAARPWRTKDLWRTFLHGMDAGEGRAFLKKRYLPAMATKPEPARKVARTPMQLVAIVAVLAQGFRNTVAGGMDSRIQRMVQKACGYRNMERIKVDMPFHVGGAAMDPVSE